MSTLPSARNWRRIQNLNAVDNSGANSASGSIKKNVIVGIKNVFGTLAINTLSALIRSEAQAVTLAGRGSQAARMVRAAMRANKLSQFYLMLVDAPSGNKATDNTTLTGTATESGALKLELAGNRYGGNIEASVAVDDTAAEILAALKADAQEYGSELATGALEVGKWYEITATESNHFGTGLVVGNILQASATTALDASNKVKPVYSDWPVFVQVVSTTITLIAQHAGEYFNGISAVFNYFGDAGGESLPAGLTLGKSQLTLSGGTGTVDMTNTLAAMGAFKYYFLIHPFNDTTALAAIEADLKDRWDPTKRYDGHALTFLSDSHSDLTTFGNALNDEHCTIPGMDTVITPADECAAYIGAVVAGEMENDPALPVWNIECPYILPPVAGDRFDSTEENALAFDGISYMPIDPASERVKTGRIITTYQRNVAGAEDNSYLDINVPLLVSAIDEYMMNDIASTWPRAKLAADGTPISSSQKVATPKDIKSRMISKYAADLCFNKAWCQAPDTYAASVTVSVNTDDPRFVDVEHSPILMSQFGGARITTKFKLQVA